MLLYFGYRIMNLQYSKYILLTECTRNISKNGTMKIVCSIFSLQAEINIIWFSFLHKVPFMTSNKRLRICFEANSVLMPSPKCNFFSILEHILHGIITTSILIESRECLYTILCIVFVAKRTLYVIGNIKDQ